MSEKTAETTNKKRFTTFLKWGGIVIGIAALEFAGIFSAVKLTESRHIDKEDQLQAVLSQLQKQTAQINNLEKLPVLIAANAEKIATNTGLVNLVTEDLRTLKDEVGNKKLELLSQQLLKLNHRMETVEESKNLDTIILSLALIIKENALYNRSFANEADILADLSQEQETITSAVREIVLLKDKNILSDAQLIEQYRNVSNNLVFANDIIANKNNTEKENRSAVAKSIELIKDTVSGINFDKVVVMKKEKKTNEQELLLNTLTQLVNTHDFKDAITFIEQNRTSFREDLNPEFTAWVERASQKVMFDNAISKIIASELSAIRKDFAEQTSSQTPSED